MKGWAGLACQIINLFYFSYRKNLEEVITADEIRGLKDLQMVGFELEVWKALGRKYIKQEDRRMVYIIYFYWSFAICFYQFQRC